MMKKIVLLLAFVLVTSCSNREIYNKNFKDFPANRWLKDSQYVFNFEVDDDQSLYNVSMNLSYSHGYQFESIPVIFKIVHPDNKEEIISKNVFLQENGKEKGDCLGDMCDLNFTIRENIKLSKGKYEVIVLNNSPLPYLPNITRLGLNVSKSE